MRLTYERRQSCHPAVLRLAAVPLVSALSCAIIHPAHLALHETKSPNLDAAIAALYRNDSLFAKGSTMIWEAKGPLVQSLRDDNAGNRVFISALDDLFRTVSERDGRFPDDVVRMSVNGSQVLLYYKNGDMRCIGSFADSCTAPDKMLALAPEGSSRATVKITYFHGPGSATFRLSGKPDRAELSRLRNAMSAFCNDSISLDALEKLATR